MLLAEKLVFISLKWLVHLMFFHNFKQWLKSSWSPQIILQESYHNEDLMSHNHEGNLVRARLPS